MNLQELVDKMNAGTLSEADQGELFQALSSEVLMLKEKEPEKYLELLKKLTVALEETK